MYFVGQKSVCNWRQEEFYHSECFFFVHLANKIIRDWIEQHWQKFRRFWPSMTWNMSSLSDITFVVSGCVFRCCVLGDFPINHHKSIRTLLPKFGTWPRVPVSTPEPCGLRGNLFWFSAQWSDSTTVQSTLDLKAAQSVEIAVYGCVWHFILDICMYVYIYICIIIWLCIMYMTFMYVLGSTVSKVCCDQRPLGSGTLTWHCLRSRFFSPNFAFYWPCECTGVYRNPNPWGYLSFTLVSFEVRQDRVGKGGSRTAMLEFEL